MKARYERRGAMPTSPNHIARARCWLRSGSTYHSLCLGRSLWMIPRSRAPGHLGALLHRAGGCYACCVAPVVLSGGTRVALDSLCCSNSGALVNGALLHALKPLNAAMRRRATETPRPAILGPHETA